MFQTYYVIYLVAVEGLSIGKSAVFAGELRAVCDKQPKGFVEITTHEGRIVFVPREPLPFA